MLSATKTLIIQGITKTESNNCFIIHCFEENNDKHTFARNLNWYCNWNSFIARATRRLVSYLLICRLCWFPKLAVGSQPMRRQIVSTMYNNATYYHALPYPETMENEIWTKDKTELQHLHWFTIKCAYFSRRSGRYRGSVSFITIKWPSGRIYCFVPYHFVAA